LDIAFGLNRPRDCKQIYKNGQIQGSPFSFEDWVNSQLTMLITLVSTLLRRSPKFRTKSPSLTWTHLICFISSFWGIPPKTIQQCINAVILKNVCKWKLIWLLFQTRYRFLFSNGTCVLHDKYYIVNGGKKPTIKNLLELTSWQSPRISQSLGWILRFFFFKKNLQVEIGWTCIV
jgi:hypothetical protein